MKKIMWEEKCAGQKAQFVADVIIDSLFDYSFDSNKVPALNLHFFCLDYLSTFQLVKEGTMKDGNMIPLNEELEWYIKESPWLPNEISPNAFFFKNSYGVYEDISKGTKLSEDKKTEYYVQVVRYIQAILESRIDYQHLLVGKISNIIGSPTFDIHEQKQLYYCIRELLCELINKGYSKQHIYKKAKDELFCKRTVQNAEKYIADFFESFSFEEHNYIVVFGLKGDAGKQLADVFKNVREATEDENEIIGAEYVAQIEIHACDSVTAAINAKNGFANIINIYNAGLHSTTIGCCNDVIVKDIKDEASQTIIKGIVNPILKNKVKSTKERQKWLAVAIKNDIGRNLLTAFDFHNNALNETEPQTQLITLWTIFELLIETKQNLMNRVNYIVDMVSPILCNEYYSNLTEALYQKIANNSKIKTIIQTYGKGNTAIQKLALILHESSDTKDEIVTKMDEYPLQKYRLICLSELFVNPSEIKKDIDRHSKRIKWQMMRIYRNRCMVVHDGSSMPYIDQIIENLHFYIDKLLDYLMINIEKGNDDFSSIFSIARYKEQRIFEKINTKDASITSEEFLELFF